MTPSILEKKTPAKLKIEAKQVVHDFGMLGRKAQGILVVDVSGSMTALFRMGIVQGLVERALGMVLNFDDDGSLPVYALDTGVYTKLPDITKDNLEGYVDRHLRSLVGGGTNYAPTFKQMGADFEPGDPGFALFCTDGDNWDEGKATTALRELSRIPMFIQAMGIGSDASFKFLRDMDDMSGRVIDNAGFSQVFLEKVTDDQLFRMMLAEFAGIDPQTGRKAGQSYHEKAQAAGMLDENFKWDGRKAAAPASSGGGRRRGFLGSIFGG